MSDSHGAPAWRRYLRFWKRDVQSDIDAELRFHLDARIAALVATGQEPAAARHQAIAEFGDLADVRHALHDIDARIASRQSRGEWLDGLRQDAAFGVRSLLRTPAVTATIILTLALGLGMNAALFSFLDQIFVRDPSGVSHPASVRRVWRLMKFGEKQIPTFWPGFSYPLFASVTQSIGPLARTTLSTSPAPKKLGRGENAPKASLVYAGADYFDILGVRPAAGRLFSAEENRLGASSDVAVVSDAFRRRALNPDTSAVGQRITIDNRPFTVIGVLPPDFTGIDIDATDIWVPLNAVSVGGTSPWWQSNNMNGFAMLVQPAAGVSDRQVEDRATLAMRSFIRAPGWPADSTTVSRLGSIIAARGPGEPKQEVKIATRLAGVTAIVLLIACANVINLLLARAVRRRREIAVRLALGISRARLVRLLIVESVLLALAAAAAAVIAAQWGGSLLRTLLLPNVHWAGGALNLRVVVFALVAAMIAGVVAGLVPAWQASRPDLTGALKAGAREGVTHRSRLRSALVIVQAALSVLLLVGAGLFVKSLENIHGVNIGFDADRIVFADVRFDTEDSVRDAGVRATIDQLADRFRSIPGVEQVALAGNQPMNAFSFITWFTETFPDGKTPPATFSAVSPGYFSATGLRIVSGTDFPNVRGAAMPRVMVVNRTMARSVWPGQNAIGQCMRFTSKTAPCYTVIGVVDNARRTSVIEDETAQYYLPIDAMPEKGWSQATLVIRAEPAQIPAISSEVRLALKEAWPSGIAHIVRMSEALEPQYHPWKLGATLFSTFGLLALIVAAIGIYSTVSYGVTQRTREFGVRVALGARVGDVVGHVIGEGLRTVVLGVAVGVALSLAAGRLLGGLLYGVEPSNPVVLLGVAVLLLGVAAVAAFAPAWRAARVDPMTALRSE